MEVIHGLDYLVDYYAFLGVPRNASPAEIRHAYLEKQKLYHPDHYESLAPDLKERAAQVARLASEAYRRLSDPQLRKAYDAVLAAWDGPLSDSGMPIIDLSRPRFRPEAIFGDEIKDSLADIEEKARMFSGHVEAMFAVIEQAYRASPNPPSEIVEAYRQALAKKELYLMLKEGLTWDRSGLENQQVDEHVGLDYLETLERRIAEARARVTDAARKTLQLCAAGELKLLAAGEAAKEFADSPQTAIERYVAKAEQRLEAAAEELRSAAKDRVETAEKWRDTIQGRYVPDQPEMFRRLALGVKVGDQTTWFAFRLEGTAIGTDETVSKETLAGLSDPEAARQWIAGGANILMLELHRELDVRGQVEAAVVRHFEELPKA